MSILRVALCTGRRSFSCDRGDSTSHFVSGNQPVLPSVTSLHCPCPAYRRCSCCVLFSAALPPLPASMSSHRPCPRWHLILFQSSMTPSPASSSSPSSLIPSLSISPSRPFPHTLRQWAPLSVSSSVAPAPLPRLSASAVQGEGRDFFGKFWSGHTGSGGGSGGGGGGGENSNDLDNGDREGAGGGGGLGRARRGGDIAGQWGGFDREGARQRRRHSDVGPSEPQAAAAAIWRGGEARDAAAAPGEKAGEVGKDGGGGEKEEGFFQALRRKIFEGDREDRDKAKSASQTRGAGGSTAKAQESPSQGSKVAAARPSEMQASLRFTPVRTAERSTAQRGTPPVGVNGGSGGGSGARATASRSRSRSMATAGAGAGAGPGAGGYSPIITIPPLPMAEGVPSPSSKDPDAGAGGTRSVEPSADHSTAEAAAAKFGLVRMDYGDH